MLGSSILGDGQPLHYKQGCTGINSILFSMFSDCIPVGYTSLQLSNSLTQLEIIYKELL